MTDKLKNVEKAAQRLRDAVKEKEEIVLYGDADLDGSASLVILKETLESLGAQIREVYFPDRGEEGYGLNIGALDYLQGKIEGKFILILLDLGITSFKEIKEAQERDIEVIIIDHHQPLEEVPQASLIVDPKQKGDDYPFKNLANAGVTFKLAQEILGSDFNKQEKSFLELTALATIADMMEQAEDNEVFIEQGLESLKKTERVGLKVLKDLFKEEEGIREISQQMISLLNAGDIVDHKTVIYNLLIVSTKEEAQEIVADLMKKSEARQKKIALMVEEVENSQEFSSPVIFKVGQDWDVPLLGTVASKISHKVKKPVFLVKKSDFSSRGAVRMPSGLNAVDVMNKYSELLETFGGHPPAAGFTIKNENIEKFKEKLINHFK